MIMKLSVVMPVYNEINTIADGLTVNEADPLVYEMIERLVDDLVCR